VCVSSNDSPTAQQAQAKKIGRARDRLGRVASMLVA
jgi:hypothetical protein